jgi:GNAT superfamily N-acetyltransferase
MAFPVRECRTPDEMRLSLEIYNAVNARRAVTPEQSEAFERGGRASAEYLAGDVGSLTVGIQASHPEECLTLIAVLPEHRRRGAGTALYETASQWAREQGVDVLATWTESDDEDGLAFAQNRGLVEVWREIGFVLDVRQARVEPLNANGIQLVWLHESPELAPRLYDVQVDALPGMPGEEDWQPPGLDVFLTRTVKVPNARIVAARAGDEVVGYAQLQVHPERAVHGMTAVKRAWRGRGIARAMKLGQIAWAKEHGIGTLEATNEERNAAMIRINESLGYRRAPGRIGLRGPVKT